MTSLSSGSVISARVRSITSRLNSSSGEPTLTPAERAREKRLRDDPMASVVGPLFVDCRRCGARIKLSPKSIYDPFHWKTHKERCLRKPPGARLNRKPRKDQPDPAQQQPLPAAMPEHPITATIKSEPGATRILTPPLTPDKDEDLRTEDNVSVPEAVSAPPSPPAKPKEIQQADGSFEEYATRSHGKNYSVNSRPRDHWQSWSWSNLKAPNFAVDSAATPTTTTTTSVDDYLTQDNEDSMAAEEIRLRNDAVLSLSLLSQSAPRFSR